MSRPPQGKATDTRHAGVSVIRAPHPPPHPGMKKPSAEKDSDEYRQRRERNNLAVKKSRQRSKQKAVDTQQRVDQLKEENQRLEAKITLLSKELSVLKDLFLEHAHSLADGPPGGGAGP
ncbi:CCAAT/enhancer-binding protein gamma [Pseudoliparis swirei]|uniref:CCAAT/enhancer-binding protein gamma n=1 Tax=Pseudoliparis swirei TaxID=2059687 RepID=UPI0024BDFC1B|nr:CCAAT/enhancer-binding protein gamma [Pseudoliparis swirei]